MGTFADLTDDGFAASSAALGVRLNADAAPDKAAETLKLARRYNLPPMLAEQFAEDYKARAQTEDAHETFKRAPRLGSWIAEQPERAKVASDDLETLGGIDVALRMLKNAPRSLASGVPRFGASVYGAAAAPMEVIGQGMDLAENSFRDLIGLPRYEGPQPGMVVGGILRGQQQNAMAISESIYTTQLKLIAAGEVAEMFADRMFH